LLCLANQYGFTIIEDDYDYDFHYLSSPYSSLISADDRGMVVYVGTLSKTVSPAIRTGYLIAPKNLLTEIVRLRQLVDGQGDPIMELTLAEMFDEGEIRRHMKKALKTYHERRDFFCDLLSDKLSDIIDFKKPDGGLAIWAKFDKSVPLPELNIKMKAKGVIISNGLINNTGKTLMNATRMGFAWMNEKEAEKAILTLNDTIRRGF
jgi:GntR family transcriptional regulator/MocR family aminotransferase